MLVPCARRRATQAPVRSWWISDFNLQQCAATVLAPVVLGLSCVVFPRPADSAVTAGLATRLPADDAQGILVLDGSFVHNVGEVQLNITNWGLIGSAPADQLQFSDAPSAMWPAGSGVDYLYAAGLWVGALKNGIPSVTTGVFDTELLPNGEDPLDTVYTMRLGEPGGARYPDPTEDDDEDGVANEDPKNGVDDDGDGRIDEDFAAIGNQHFRCVMRDDTPLAVELNPDHEPLDIQVVQHSFQWENDAVDDFVGFEFTVKNVGISSLHGVYLGFFADCDIGPREGARIANDDLPGFLRQRVRASDGRFVPISVAYMYDADGDNGQATGYIGLLFLNHDTDPLGETAPPQVGITSFQQFSGQAPFDRGGDPTNDAERYELLSRAEIDAFPTDPSRASDFRILLATGPFDPLDVQQELTFQAALVMGEGLDGLRRNCAEAALTYYGAYFDRDGDPETGRFGRETRVCLSDFGPPGPGNPIFGLFQDCVDSTDPGAPTPTPIGPDDLDDQGCVYINHDCPFETGRGATNCTLDGTVAERELAGCTGVLGREAFVPWLVGLAPPPPHMRLWQTDDRVHVFWDNHSQLTEDLRLQRVDFESYRIWRADGWERPFGSSIQNGPEARLWRLIGEYDVVDFFEQRRELPNGQIAVQTLPLGPNTGLSSIAYVPWVLRPGSPQAAEFQELATLLDRIVAENPTLGPERRVRYRDERRQVTPLGQAYPELQRWECCYAQLDTLFQARVGVQWYEYVDREVHNGIYYFHAVTATDFAADPTTVADDHLLALGPGLAGDPQSNFSFSVPRSNAQSAQERAARGANIFVVPNPATREALAEFSQLRPNGDDPTGVRVEFRNLPRARNVVRIYTLAGDLVTELPHDGMQGDGSVAWNLVSHNGQEIVSGIYLFSVESNDSAFDRVVGRFVVIR